MTPPGMFNTAVLTPAVGEQIEDHVCDEVPVVAMNKTITAGPYVNADGSYSITYQIAVWNTGGVDTDYDLVDDLQFGDGFVVNSAAVTDAPEAATVLDTWTGLGEPGSASLVVAREVPIPVGINHTYAVTVTGTIPAVALRNPVAVGCPSDGAYGQTGGFHNVAIVTSGMQELADDVCTPPPPPELPTPTPPPPLAVTGSDATGVGIVAGIAGLIALLGIAILISRRRKQLTLETHRD